MPKVNALEYRRILQKDLHPINNKLFSLAELFPRKIWGIYVESVAKMDQTQNMKSQLMLCKKNYSTQTESCYLKRNNQLLFF